MGALLSGRKVQSAVFSYAIVARLLGLVNCSLSPMTDYPVGDIRAHREGHEQCPHCEPLQRGQARMVGQEALHRNRENERHRSDEVRDCGTLDAGDGNVVVDGREVPAHRNAREQGDEARDADEFDEVHEEVADFMEHCVTPLHQPPRGGGKGRGSRV